MEAVMWTVTESSRM